VFLLSFLFFQSFSQQSEECNVELNKQYILSYWDNGWDAALAPLEWNKNEWLAFSAVTVTSAFIYLNEKEIFDFFHKNQHDFTVNLSKYAAEPFGNPAVTLSLAGGLCLYGLISGDKKSESTGLIGVEALLINGVITLVAKNVFNRQRPSASHEEDPYNWYGPFGKEYHGAFPSGHTSSAFTFAAILANSYKDIWWIPYTAYSLATLTALSRLHDAKHWPSDVVFGAALGYGVGSLVYNNHCKVEKAHSFLLLPSNNGISLIYDF